MVMIAAKFSCATLRVAAITDVPSRWYASPSGVAMRSGGDFIREAQNIVDFCSAKVR